MGYRSWRAVHWLAYASWPVAVLHGLGTGSDVKSAWSEGLTLVCLAAVLWAIAVRLGRAVEGNAGVRAGATLLSVAVPVGLVVFALAGPLEKGWARRAGTPAKLLGPVPAAGRALTKPRHPTTTTATASATPTLERAFSANLSGTVVQSSAPGGAVIELGLRLSGGVTGQLRVRMGGAPLSTGGLSLTGSQVDLTGPGLRSALGGKVLSLQGNDILARVTDAYGTSMRLEANLSINQDTGAVTGTLRGTPLGKSR
jgi:hypothetical protein